MNVFLGSGTGWGYWTALAFGQGSATTGTLVPPTAVTASVEGGTVFLSWDAAVSPGGAPQDGYHVTRVNETDNTTDACGTSPSTATLVLQCEDQPQPDGTYRYIVTALHYSWTGVSEASNTVTVDTTAPDAPSAPELAAASDSGVSSTDGVTNDPTPTFTGTAEAGSTVRLYSRATLIGSGVATGGSYSITTESTLSEGLHTVTAQATDTEGNVSDTSAGTDVTIDTVAPTVTVARADGQPAATNTQPVAFTVTFSESVTGFTAADVELTAPAGASVAVTGSGATYTVEVTGMTADGTVTVSVGADAGHDLAGHGNTEAPAESSVTGDSTAPAPPEAPRLHVDSDTGSSSTDGLTNDATPMFTGTAEPGAAVTLYEGDTALGSDVAGLDGSWSITSSTLAEGAHTLTVVATDAAGNISGTSDDTDVTIDVTAPAAASTPDLAVASDSGSSSTDNYTNDTTPTFSGTASTGTAVTLYDGSTAVGTQSIGAGSYSITTGILLDGARTFTATATDAAGNVSLASGLSVTIDTTASQVVISDDDVTYSNGLVTTSGTAGYATGDPASVSVVICVTNSFPCSTSNTDYSGMATVSATTGDWSNTSSDVRTSLCVPLVGCAPLAGPGQIYVQATQTDQAGNVGTSNTVSKNFG